MEGGLAYDWRGLRSAGTNRSYAMKLTRGA